jgi:hypothetical protein
MEMPHWETELQKNSKIFTDTVFNIIYFFHQLCTQCFISYLKQWQQVLKYFLVTDIGIPKRHYKMVALVWTQPL